MQDLLHAIQSGSVNLWLYIPSAILLGALHGLEPGHSKTIMAAFIIAIRGTVLQAVLLGVAAAVSHSLIIALLAALALHFGSQWNAETVEPYLQIFSAASMLILAAWMFLRTKRDLNHHHHHGHHHGHHHAEEQHLLLGSVPLLISIHEHDSPPVFQVRSTTHLPASSNLTLETLRADGTRETFHFLQKHDLLESITEIPEPHQFEARLELVTSDGIESGSVSFSENSEEEYQDAHEREHAEDLRRRFEGKHVTTPQIVLFGAPGGLMPCPAAFGVFLVCVQIKRVALGTLLVAGFSFGLAATMVATGVLAALSVKHAERKFRGFGDWMRYAPYVSCVLLVLLALFMAKQGWQSLQTTRSFGLPS